MAQQKMLLLDGNSLINRAFYALPMLSNSKGLHTNGIYGFMNMLLRVMEEQKPSHVLVAFDKKAPTFRHKEFEMYKAHRKKMPDELAQQLPVLKDILSAMGIAILESEGYEADDIIGTISEACQKENMPVVIISGDRDVLQLVSDDVTVFLTRKGISDVEEINKQCFEEMYQIDPQQLIDVKSLMGDKSDNIPGVPGIGEKTALKLVRKYGSIEGVLENIDDIKGDKLRNNLETYKDQVVINKKLAAIYKEVPMDRGLDGYRLGDMDTVALTQLFRDLEFKTLMARMGLEPDQGGIHGAGEADNGSAEAVDIETMEDKDDLGKVVSAVRRSQCLALYIDIDRAYLYDGQRNYTIKVKDSFIGEGVEPQLLFDTIKDVLADQDIQKYVLDSKALYTMLNTYGVELKGVAFDVMVAAYLLDATAKEYNLEQLCERYSVHYQKDAPAYSVYYLAKAMETQLKDKELDKLFFDIELPLANVLASMEISGFKVDVDMLRQLSEEFQGEIDRLTKKIFSLSGEEFNINSPKQLSKILFEKLQLPVIKKTKTGYSTDNEVLEQLSNYHPIADYIIEYRQMAKFDSTYIHGLLNVAHPVTHKVHTTFNQTVTATGRISSTEPNLQNIPVKLESGRQIRKAFIPGSEEYILLDGDYSQIELRVLAHISGDENLMDAFIKGEDVHLRTASEVFDIPMEEVTPQMRNRAKAVNFGIVYGISDFGLARDLKISRYEAKRYIDNYLEKYKGVKRYMHDIIEFGKRNGYVKTLLNRRRYIPQLSSRNHNVRAFGERVAMNTPIQGTAADIIKLAMINVYRELKARGLKSKIILQVHDELLLEVYKPELDMVREIVRDKMENCIKLKVPLVVDIGIGDNWYDVK
ncbi:MAG TPA: DNA polymerase I [Clostridiales bacterium]|nr:DNA polymerase I [Clostridiales bacterium]